MWFWPNKKEIKKSFSKIKSSITELTSQSFKQQILIEKNKEDIVSRKEIDLMIREAILKVQSAPNTAPNSELLTEPIKEKHFDKVVLLNANKTRPDIIKQAIRGLLEKGLRTTDIFNIIVTEKKIVGKTQFYHYLTLIKSELRTPIRTELRTKLKK